MNKFTQSQSGAVLIISLIMLLALTIIGLTSSSVTSLEEKMAANAKDINLAFQAAEATLRYVETTQLINKPNFQRDQPDNLQGTNGIYTNLKSCKDAAAETAKSTGSTTEYTNTRDATPAGYRPFYEKIDAYFGGWSNISDTKKVRIYDIGTGTNKKLANVARNPAYIIEEVNCTPPPTAGANNASLEAASSQTPDSTGEIISIRITARGWGSNPNSVVTLQSIVKKQW